LKRVVRRAIIRRMLASRSKPVRSGSRGAAAWVSLLVIAACSSPNDFFDRPTGTGGLSGAAGNSGRAGTSGSAGTVGTSGGSGNAAGNAGSAGTGNSTAVGGTAGTSSGSGGSSDGQAGEGGESGDMGVGGSGGAAGSAGGGSAGMQGEAGQGGLSGSAGDGGAGGGGLSGGAGISGSAGLGGTGGALGGSGGKGGKGDCGSQPEVCDGENNNCTGGADEGDACPSGCDGLTEEGRTYVLCSGSSYSGSWQAAEERCQGAISAAAGVAMKLAVIETEDENELLAEWVQDRNVSDGAWMGANDLDVDNEWSWGTGASRVPFYVDEGEGNNGDVVMNRYNDWGNGRPNGDTAMQDDEDCGHFDPVYNWRWNDRRCGDNLPAFVCEQAL
jgi:hypothetical protein